MKDKFEWGVWNRDQQCWIVNDRLPGMLGIAAILFADKDEAQEFADEYGDHLRAARYRSLRPLPDAPYRRESIVDAYTAFALYREETGALLRRIQASPVDELRSIGAYGQLDSEWEGIEALDDDAREHYFALVAKKESQKVSDELRHKWDRIHKTDGVTIQVSNCEDDPFQIMFEIHDEIADAWADANGSICGGTWECPDGDKSFVYDIGSWYQGVFEELKEEGYNLDFSNYSEPEAEDMAIADHWNECPKCEGTDFATAKKHVAALKKEADAVNHIEVNGVSVADAAD